MVAFRNFSTLTAFLWEKPSHMFGLALFLDFKALWSVQCCWAGFLAAQKSFDRDWQAVEKVFDANSHVHAFNHWVVTEKKIFPPKKLIQIHLRRRKAIKIDRKERKAWISSYFLGKKVFSYVMVGSVYSRRIQKSGNCRSCLSKVNINVF